MKCINPGSGLSDDGRSGIIGSEANWHVADEKGNVVKRILNAEG